MNKIIVIGHPGRDPEMRYTPCGQAVTSFCVASSRTLHHQEGELLARSLPGYVDTS